MTDSTNNQPASKTPTHIAYHVRNREGGKGFWTRIGSAWAHKDGNPCRFHSASLQRSQRPAPLARAFISLLSTSGIIGDSPDESPLSRLMRSQSVPPVAPADAEIG